MSRQLFPHQILWLASYPKSGNTWFRAFLTALMTEGGVEINKLKTDGIFSDRFIFDYCADIESRDLYDRESRVMIAEVYRYLASERSKLSIIKIHDALTVDPEGNSIVPADVTRCAIYFIRNPLDIPGSLANHNSTTIQESVNVLNNKNARLLSQTGNLNRYPQFRQYLFDWSSHVNSWTINPPFPVCVIRYEDMLSDTFGTFQKILQFVGMEYTPEQINKAIEASSFEALKKQETEGGFREKPIKSNSFFRSGKNGNWEKELNSEQIQSILAMHKEVMERYNYKTQ
jgi:hypothetical protein